MSLILSPLEAEIRGDPSSEDVSGATCVLPGWWCPAACHGYSGGRGRSLAVAEEDGARGREGKERTLRAASQRELAQRLDRSTSGSNSGRPRKNFGRRQSGPPRESSSPHLPFIEYQRAAYPSRKRDESRGVVRAPRKSPSSDPSKWDDKDWSTALGEDRTWSAVAEPRIKRPTAGALAREPIGERDCLDRKFDDFGVSSDGPLMGRRVLNGPKQRPILRRAVANGNSGSLGSEPPSPSIASQWPRSALFFKWCSAMANGANNDDDAILLTALSFNPCFATLSTPRIRSPRITPKVARPSFRIEERATEGEGAAGGGRCVFEEGSGRAGARNALVRQRIAFSGGRCSPGLPGLG
ncbi:hypothetical protein KM043_008762 [Ampulex compressa]|nr:hypothetical protein KM043_008762 [Ampulex compressa]